MQPVGKWAKQITQIFSTDIPRDKKISYILTAYSKSCLHPCLYESFLILIAPLVWEKSKKFIPTVVN